MPPRYDVLFLFTAPQGHLVEIKRLDRPDTAPKDQVFHWLWVDVTTVMSLRFLGMRTSPRQRRSFEEAQLEFDAHHAELRWIDGPVIDLVAHHAGTMPTSVSRRIDQHLS
jgi:hypothetical protein